MFLEILLTTLERYFFQALYLLLQCGFNAEEALRRQRLNVIPPTNMSLWSEDECTHFENGLCSFGKDFHQIQLHKVRSFIIYYFEFEGIFVAERKR